MITIDSPPPPPNSTSARSGDRRTPFLMCQACGRSEPRPPDALRRLAEGRWMECCGRVMVPVEVPTTASEEEDTPWADRRLSDRRRPRVGTQLEVRRGGMGLGPSIGIETEDVSANGIKVRIRGNLRRGDRVVITLRPPGGIWETRALAEVCWCVAAKDGTALAGVKFQRPLSTRELAELAE